MSLKAFYQNFMSIHVLGAETIELDHSTKFGSNDPGLIRSFITALIQYKDAVLPG